MNQSTSSMFTNQADETHLGWFSASIDAHWFETPHPQPQCRSCAVLLFLHINCQIRGRKRLPVGPKGVLAVFHVRGTNRWWAHTPPYVYIHPHACKVCSQTRCNSASHHQWHKPSVAVFRLHWALLMQRVPYNGTHFHFHPRTAAPPFCSSHLHLSLCTHNM